MSAAEASKKLVLLGAKRYNLDGKLFLSHQPDNKTQIVYRVSEDDAAYLLDQYDPQSGFSFFEPYEGPEEGIVPGVASDDDKVARRARPPEGHNERGQRRRREVVSERRPRGATLTHRGQQLAPIENGDTQDATPV